MIKLLHKIVIDFQPSETIKFAPIIETDKRIQQHVNVEITQSTVLDNIDMIKYVTN